jgi:hypothetical protein
VRQLRALVLQNPRGYATAPPEIRLDRLLELAPGTRIVLTADPECPLCRTAVAALATRTGRASAVVLLHTPTDAYQEWATDGLTVVTDRDAWRPVAHLTPPVLLRLRPDGVVDDLVLPVAADQIAAALDGWSDTHMTPTQGESDVAHAGADPAR